MTLLLIVGIINILLIIDLYLLRNNVKELEKRFNKVDKSINGLNKASKKINDKVNE